MVGSLIIETTFKSVSVKFFESSCKTLFFPKQILWWKSEHREQISTPNKHETWVGAIGYEK